MLYPDGSDINNTGNGGNSGSGGGRGDGWNNGGEGAGAEGPIRAYATAEEREKS